MKHLKQYKENIIQKGLYLHNLEVLYGKTREGEDKTGIMVFLFLHRLFYLVLLTYLLLIPILYYLIAKLKIFIDKIHLPGPNIMFGLFLAFNCTYGNKLRALNDRLDGHGIIEIKEFDFSFILFMLPLSGIMYKISRKAL